jgi:hypothetical protein
MGSGSRDPEFPQGLFGVWTTDDDPRWAGDCHLNYNYQAQFYGLYSSNHDFPIGPGKRANTPVVN